MSLKIYNTLTRKQDTFKPLGKVVKIYSCGPTVYWYQHIGNLRTYIFSDILKKVLKYNKYDVKHVMNVTDVGHLTSDADEGEDKIEKAAQKEGKTASDLANYYFGIFKEDFKKLNIEEPDIWCKATEHITDQIELIKILEEKDYTYRTNDGIYFDTSKLKDYGKLARLNIEELEAGKRVEMGEKKNKTDFALWKFSDKPGLRQQEWISPWGIGFPGWHVECSSMSSKYLGKKFDIHTGGEDHIPVHHTNEIAQSESAFGKKPWVKYWVHGAFLIYKGEKVSKSKGGLYTITELEGLGYKPLHYRYLCLTTNYRMPLNFSLESLDSAKNSYERLKNLITEIRSSNKEGKDNKKYLTEFKKDINDDLNMPKALSVLWEVVKDKELGGKSLSIISEMDKVFSLDLLKEEKVHVSFSIEKLIEEREEARRKKNFSRADKIRDELLEKGIILEDTNQGVKWKKV